MPLFLCSFETLLPMTKFMTPDESRNWQNLQGVMMFGKEKLVESAREQKWDRVKLVCTQMYNKVHLYDGTGEREKKEKR